MKEEVLATDSDIVGICVYIEIWCIFFFSEKGDPQSWSTYLTFCEYAKMRKLVSDKIGGSLQCIDKNLRCNLADAPMFTPTWV